MKPFFIAALLSTTLMSPVFADQFDFDSKVSDVTVYPRGAEVTRLALGQIVVGDHVITIDDLPGEVLADSVRVEVISSAKVQIGSFDVRQEYVSSKDQIGARVAIERQIEGLNDQVAELGELVNNANTQRNMLQTLAGQAILPRKGEGSSVAISADDLNALMQLTGDKFAAISKVIGQARIDQRKFLREIEELQKKMSELAPQQVLKTVVAVNLSSEGVGDAEFVIRYKIQEAGWAPVYDAKLTLGTNGKDSKIKIIRRASVRQASTETWDDVTLTLSTARPSTNTQVSHLSSYVLRERRVERERRSYKKERRRTGIVQNMAPAPVAESDGVLGRVLKLPRKAKFKQVAVAFSGFLAEYNISGKVSVNNTGADKNVVIGQKEFDAEISVYSVPKLDPAAYLSAHFTVEDQTPWLPGTVMLSRDGVYLGKADLPLLNPGEDFDLGFGQDDFVKVKRSQVKDKTGESGFISTVNVVERKFVTTVTNLHDFPMKVTIEDQIPYGAHEDIEVEMVDGTTKPTETNIDKKRGILAWEKTIEAKGEHVINFGYKVSWPEKMKITPVR